MKSAYEKNPERFRNQAPIIKPLERAVWINKPGIANSEDKVVGFQSLIRREKCLIFAGKFRQQMMDSWKKYSNERDSEDIYES